MSARACRASENGLGYLAERTMASRRLQISRRLAVALLPLAVALTLFLLGEVAFWITALIALGSIPVSARIVLESTETRSSLANALPDIRSDLGQIDSVAPAIIDSLPDALLAVDKELVVLESNQSARDLLGSGQRDRNIGLSLRHPIALEAIEKALANDKAVNLEISLLSPGERNLAMSVIPVSKLTDRNIPPVLGDKLQGGAIIVLQDVTTLRKSEQMRADFVTNASHELRTPLASLVGFIETLQGSAAEDAAARGRFLDIMAREAGRMARLIDDLLSLSRIEMDEHVRPTESVSVGSLLGGVSEILERRAADRDMVIRVDLEEPVPNIVGDLDQMTQVFQNLIDNAIKYGAEGTQILVRSRMAERLPETGDRGVVIDIINQGDVIPIEQIPRLTDRFYRVDAARSRELGSTGLGLAIVKHIISRHRGALTIESNETMGTRFSVGLPVEPCDFPSADMGKQVEL